MLPPRAGPASGWPTHMSAPQILDLAAEALRERFGVLDGRASERAADLIAAVIDRGRPARTVE